MVKIFSIKTRNFTYPKWNQDKDLELLYEVVKLESKPLNCILRKIFFSTWSAYEKGFFLIIVFPNKELCLFLMCNAFYVQRVKRVVILKKPNFRIELF